MTDSSNIDVEPGIPTNAVSVLGDSADEFPVLKAFQQYIDAEQNKARKRMVSLCIFFGCLMTVVIVVFLVLLNGVSQRNQALNDKLIEYLVKDRDRQAAVVVQPPADNSAVYGLTAKLEEMQKKLAASEAELLQKKAAEKAEADAKAVEAASREAFEKARIKEALEIERLKHELEAERAKAKEDKEMKRQQEIESYRRKYYPYYYEQKDTQPPSLSQPKTQKADPKATDGKEDDEIEALIREYENERPVNYFEEDDEEGRPLPQAKKTEAPVQPSSYSIPVEVKGTKTKWRIPNS